MSRIDVGLSSLVGALLPASLEHDDQSADKRHEEALRLAKSILTEHDNAEEPHDLGHVSDLIKKKLWREYNAPEKAIQFGNLYSRLLTLPILTQKQAILYLLHQLAILSNNDASQEPESPRRYSIPAHQNDRQSPVEPELHDGKRSTLKDVSPMLSRGPHSKGDGLQQENEDSRYTGERRSEKPRTQTTKGDAVSTASYPKLGNNGIVPPESNLLRDLPFTLQGLSSINLPFTSSSILSLPSNLPLPLVSLLHSLAEPSLLYRSLSDFVQGRDEGLISQSLQAAIGIELRSYLGLIATLEGEIRRALASVNDSSARKSVAKVGVTLKRCVVWTRDATMGLRLVSLMAEESKSKKGGQLITLIHSFSTSYGDPFVGTFAERMLSYLTRPFYNMLRQWIYDGELSDPYHEFFVIEQDLDNANQELDPRRVPASSVWENKYKLDDKLVPSIITEELAKKVFLIGKSLNFIRYGCGDSSWVENYSKDTSKELRYGDTAHLETSIDEAYKTTMARLIHLMNNKFKLFDHLHALKKYLLLGQGDFVVLLMESLASNLDRPAGSQYRHTLTGQLEHAIRGSNAQFDSPDVLRRLDARLLELSHGDIGWDVFTLEYKVDAPVDVVITSWASKQYLVVFNFLWRIKRVEFALGTTWRRLMTGARGVLASVQNKLGRDWKLARCCIAEMTHFINQLQYYILFEVIEASWDQLQAALAKPDCTLDDLISSHTKYLNSITHKGLLGASRSSLTGSREDSFMSQLHYLLKVMLAYRDAVDGLYSFSVAEFTRHQEYAAKIETRTAGGKRGATDADSDDLNSPLPGDPLHGKNTQSSERDTGSPSSGATVGAVLAATNDDQMLSSLRKRLQELSGDFNSRLATLLGDLLVQPDPDMKFLGVVMNFNDVYKPVRRKRVEKKEREREKKTMGEGQASEV